MTERLREKKSSLSSHSAPSTPTVPGTGTPANVPHKVKIALPKRSPSTLAANADISQITPEEWELLLNGEKYPCQLLIGTGESKDVVLNVNLAGIRLLNPKTEELMSQFDIEQILQYSYSQQNSTFSFSYLEEGRFFVTHKFLAQDFFEIHQYLGNAISIVIKLKTQIKKTGQNEILNQVDSARSSTDKSSLKELKREDSVRSQASASSVHSDNGDDADSTHHDSSSKGQLGSPSKESAETGRDSADISEGTISKSSQAKSYFEERYKLGRAEKMKDGRKSYRLSNEESRKLAESLESEELGRSHSNTEVEEKKKTSATNTKTMTGSMRLRAFSLPEVVSQFDFRSMKKKRPNVSELSERMKNTTFTEINPEALPETVTKFDEAGTPILIRTMQNSKYQITAGTIDALVESLADQNQPDSLYIDVFLQTYRNFMTPAALFEKLKARFLLKTMKVLKEVEVNHNEPMSPEGKGEAIELDAETLQLVKLRIGAVIKKWVERHWYDFEVPEMFSELTNLVNSMKEMKLDGIAIQITNALNRHKEDAEKRAANPPIVHENIRVEGIDFDAVHPKEVAHHLTLISLDLLKAIAPDEFVFYIWGKKGNPQTARLTENLQRLIDRFNKIGMWVATEICACQDLRRRIAMMEKFIAVAKHLLKIQNFNDVIAVISGLQSIPVFRLKKTWQGISQKMHSVYKELESKMGPEGNYKQYRQTEFEAKPPYIPFFALYMKDLTFMNDGNQTFLPGNMVNLEKHRTIMGAVLAIRSSQQSLYNFEMNPLLRKYCEVLYMKEEEELIQESNTLEPPTRRRASIASVSSEMSSATTEISDDSPLHTESSNADYGNN